ncbi:MAG: bacterial extracellular solute-binding family protein, partial [Deltaproteobacteria bacterium]|nr:bacterial extracellular solute-binding family protein [Deltaproteobacteria bacterium]
FTAAYLELVPRLELVTKKKLVTAATSIGTGETSIPNRLRRGEPVDVVIVADAVLLGFIKEGLMIAESYTPVARSAIGMAVRAGAHKPDISTVDALTRTLLQANSIAYSASVSGEYLANELAVSESALWSREERRKSAFSRSANCFPYLGSIM